MENRVVHSVVLLSALVVSAAGFSPGGWAQGIGMMDPGQALSRRAQQTPDLTKQAPAPPPALPGASSRGDAVAPATRLPNDMSPNDALFDAINRGDVAAARDALSRGADLEARNMLGMSPMELSVDLGRNDISFLLLSYRGGDFVRRRSGRDGAGSGGDPSQTGQGCGWKGREDCDGGARQGDHAGRPADAPAVCQ